MRAALLRFALVFAGVTTATATASAQQVDTIGNVVALTDFSQMGELVGHEEFQQLLYQQISPQLDNAQHLQWMQGDFQSFFPGIQAQGVASLGYVEDPNQYL